MFEKTEPNSAIITRLSDVRKHPNADKLQLATVCGEQVIVSLDARENDTVIYFDSNLCLSHDFLHNNNLYSVSDMNKDASQKGYFCNKGRVRAQTFRGEKSYGFVCSLDFLKFAGLDSLTAHKTEFNKFNGIEICKKYINVNANKSSFGNSVPKKSSHPKTIMFPEHWNTKQFKREVSSIPPNRLIYIEEKVHGTSGRSALVKIKRDLSFIEKVLRFFGICINEYQWFSLNGTRRILLTFKPGTAQGFYKDTFRKRVFETLITKLNDGEQLYYEVIGYQTNGGFIQKNFPYGCKVGEYKTVLYRVTANQEDGKVYDMGREYVYNRALELDMLSPVLFEKYYYTGNKDELIAKVDSYTDGKSMLDDNTLREGVVVWFEDHKGRWKCLKNKSFEFLKLESRAKDNPDFTDIEDNN